MRFNNDLTDIYQHKIIGKSIFLNEQVLNEMMPIELGSVGLESPEGKKGLSDAAHEISSDPVEKTEVLKRFYLYYIRSIKDIETADSIEFAIKVLGEVIAKLKEYDNGVYPGATKDFEKEVIGPATQSVLTDAGIKTGNTNVGYISRALMHAARNTGILKETGSVRRASEKQTAPIQTKGLFNKQTPPPDDSELDVD